MQLILIKTMKCFFCRKETNGIKIRCKDCINETRVPITQFKGGGWAGSSVSAQMSGQSKSFNKKLAPSYKDLEKNGYLDYVKKNNEEANI